MSAHDWMEGSVVVRAVKNILAGVSQGASTSVTCAWVRDCWRAALGDRRRTMWLWIVGCVVGWLARRRICGRRWHRSMRASG